MFVKRLITDQFPSLFLPFGQYLAENLPCVFGLFKYGYFVINPGCFMDREYTNRFLFY